MKVSTRALAFFGAASSSLAQDLCSPDSNTFTMKINFFQGQLGYFEVEECEGMVNPTLGMIVNTTYTFLQKDISNWFHPMGFAYGPDGALDDQDELEPVNTRTSSTCANTNSCPTPLYHLDGTFLGEPGTENFGLDDYEPKFFLPLLDWVEQGSFSIEVTFDDADITQDIFYFCHIHQFMSGRIKILDDSKTPLVATDTPAIPYEYDTPGTFDRTCGTFGLDDWQIPNQNCPDEFVCNSDEAATPELETFAQCIDAMNCRMMAGMTTNIVDDEITLFIHHMRPHHENAIEMARSLLKSGKLDCDDLTQETPACLMQVMAREIINGQNFQIQTMNAVLDLLGEDQVAPECAAGFLKPPNPSDDSGTSGARKQGSFLF